MPSKPSSKVSKAENHHHYLKQLAKITKKLGYIPTSNEFARLIDVNSGLMCKKFGTFQNMISRAKEAFPADFEAIIDETSFSDAAFLDLERSVKKYRRFVVTTAVTGCEINTKAYAALKSYCSLNKAKLLVVPCSDPAAMAPKEHRFSLSADLDKSSIVFRDLKLNDNVMISTIRLGAKQINPLTGLKRLTQFGTCILASPKQMLEHVAMSNKKTIPRALMTTGAITQPQYHTKRYMSERTAYLAQEDHKIGAVIVEIKDSTYFFYRRVEIDSHTGEFTDINRRYSPSGRVKLVTAELVQQPDWHVLSTDPEFRKVAEQVVSVVKPDVMTLEDFFDGITINPHEKHNVIVRAQKALKGQFLLSEELKACAKEIDALAAWDVKKLVFKYGNHEDFLLRWLSSAEYKDDPSNHYEGVCLAKAVLEGEAPFEHAMRKRYAIKSGGKVQFLDVNDSFKVNGIENGVHGHLGAGGKRNPGMAGLEAYGPVNAGHNHSAAIFRDVVRVGTATHLQLSYNDGPSTWTQTLNIQHRDGSRQLITAINGEWCLPDILKKR